MTARYAAVGFDVGTHILPDDMLEFFGPQGERLWRASRARGLDGEVPPLFEALRREVQKAEAAAKKP